MNETEITEYITHTFPDTTTTVAMNATFFFNDPEKKFPFATIVTTDEHDTASNLARPGVFRLNVGVSKSTFQSLVGDAKPEGHDFTAIDRILPHPVYGMMHWVCVLNPSDATFDLIKPMLREAYDVSRKRYDRR